MPCFDWVYGIGIGLETALSLVPFVFLLLGCEPLVARRGPPALICTGILETRSLRSAHFLQLQLDVFCLKDMKERLKKKHSWVVELANEPNPQFFEHVFHRY